MDTEYSTGEYSSVQYIKGMSESFGLPRNPFDKQELHRLPTFTRGGICGPLTGARCVKKWLWIQSTVQDSIVLYSIARE